MIPRDPVMRRRLRAALWVVAALIAARLFRGVRQDDAFITYRYAENLASGMGPTFNPGLRLLGTTSPGEMLLGALVHIYFGHEAMPGVMAALGAAAVVAQGAAVRSLLLPTRGELTASAAGVALAIGVAGPWSKVGLETNITYALLLTALACGEHRRWKRAAAVLAVACLFRPDALLAAGLLGGVLWWRARPHALRSSALFIGLCAPWPLFANAYYGSPLPQTLRTKFQIVSLGVYLRNELDLVTTTLLPSPVPKLAAIVLVVALAAWGAYALVRSATPVIAVLPLHGVAVLVAYAYLRPYTEHAWHLYPAIAATVVCVVVGLVELSRRGRAPRIAAGLVAVALLGLSARGTIALARDHESAKWLGARHRCYVAAAEFLVKNGQRDREAFASVEVGTLAYLSDFEADDLGGLATPIDQPPRLPIRWAIYDDGYKRMAPPFVCAARIERGDFAVQIYDLARPLPAPPATCVLKR